MKIAILITKQNMASHSSLKKVEKINSFNCKTEVAFRPEFLPRDVTNIKLTRLSLRVFWTSIDINRAENLINTRVIKCSLTAKSKMETKIVSIAELCIVIVYTYIYNIYSICQEDIHKSTSNSSQSGKTYTFLLLSYTCTAGLS